MRAVQAVGLAALTMGLAIALACGHQSSVPVVASGAITPADGGGLPFDREAQSGGISPTSSVIPPGAQVPAGTSIVVRLQRSISSARAHPEDGFQAVLVEPIVVNEHILAESGAVVTGRVVEARISNQARSSGYMRLTLSSIPIGGKLTRVRTSSTFVKGTGPKRRNAPLPMDGEGTLVGTAATGKGPTIDNAMVDTEQDVVPVANFHDAMVSPERRLKFRLIEPLPIHP